MKSTVLEMLEELKAGEVFTESNTLVDDGILDSFDIISLVSMLEGNYGIEIDGLDIIPDNFQNIEAIVALINKSKKA